MEGGSEKIEHPRSGLTPKVLVIGIILSIFAAFFNQSEYVDFYETVGALTHLDSAFMLFPGALHTTVLGGIFLSLITIGLILLIDRRGRFSKQELAMIFIIGVLITSINLSKDGFMSGEDIHEYMAPICWYFESEARQKEFLALYAGTVWCPGQFSNASYVRSVLKGNLLQGTMMPIDWGAWMPLIAYRVLSLTGMAYLGVAIALLVRRSFIEIEVLSFPWGEINLVAFEETLAFIKGEDAAGRKIRRPLILSFLIFFFLFFSMYAPNNILWLAGVKGVSFKTWMPWWTYPEKNPTVGALQWWTSDNIFEVDPTLLGLSFLPWVALLIHLWPVNHAAFFIMPIEVLIGCFVGDIFFEWIYPMILYSIGRLPTWKATDAVYGVARSVASAWYGAGVYLGLGLFIPFVIIPLWKNRSVFSPIFKAAAGRKVKKEIDPNAPTSYTSVWILVLASIIMILAGFTIVGWQITWGLPIILLSFAVGIGQLRLIAVGAAFIFATYGFANFDPGQFPGSMNAFQRHITAAIFGLADPYRVMDPAMCTFSAFWGGMTGYGGTFGFRIWWLIMGAASVLAAFYIANRVKLEGKDVLKAALIFIPVSLILFDVWHIASIYLNDVLSGRFFSISLIQKMVRRALVRSVGSIGITLPSGEAVMEIYTVRTAFVVLGIAITTTLYILRDKFEWFRISPEGFWFGVVMGPTWTLSLAMLIIKYLSTRVGGATFYEKIAKPIAIGIIIAFGANIFIQHWFQLAYKWQTAFGINYAP
ncbi:MAG: DUF6784 domain-containing protein [Nitrososphaerota archaeon]|nr:hypothetical protein [Candidatus Bathyarchaeota archaeon]MDW8048570.1 DUF6784 domain-containing protein [Nitrososphaerota archaeon]